MNDPASLEHSHEPSLEQIAKEITPKIKMEQGSQAYVRFERADGQVKDIGRSFRTSQRFGEVLQAFLEEKSVTRVARKTGLSLYMLNRHFFSNPEFCALLKSTNEAIFLEATREIRDTQKGFLQKAQQLAEDALDEMERLLNESPSEHVRFKVAQDLLDRDPRISRTKRIEGAGLKVQIDVKTLSVAAVAAREISARPEGFVLGQPAHNPSQTEKGNGESCLTTKMDTDSQSEMK